MTRNRFYRNAYRYSDHCSYPARRSRLLWLSIVNAGLMAAGRSMAVIFGANIEHHVARDLAVEIHMASSACLRIRILRHPATAVGYALYLADYAQHGGDAVFALV